MRSSGGDIMNMCIATGLVMDSFIPVNPPTEITVRTEKTGEFITLSLAGDKEGIMIQVIVTPEVKRLLKGILK